MSFFLFFLNVANRNESRFDALVAYAGLAVVSIVASRSDVETTRMRSACPDDEIATAIARSLRRRQCAALCAKIRLHVTRLMESARFCCNRKLFCARRLRLSYRTSHTLTREEEREERERKKGHSLPRLARFSPILYRTLSPRHIE